LILTATILKSSIKASRRQNILPRSNFWPNRTPDGIPLHHFCVPIQENP
jgi:hypothetical protein